MCQNFVLIYLPVKDVAEKQVPAKLKPIVVCRLLASARGSTELLDIRERTPAATALAVLTCRTNRPSSGAALGADSASTSDCTVSNNVTRYKLHSVQSEAK